MRVCLFTDTLGDLNGVARFIQDMGKQACASGLDLQIVTSTVKPCPKAPYIYNLRPMLRFPMPAYTALDVAFASKKALEAKLLELDPDIVHISTHRPIGYTACKLAKKHGYTVMGTYHTDFSAIVRENTGSEWLKRLTDRLMARFHYGFAHLFSHSKEYLQVMTDDIGVGPERSSLLKPGTDLKTFNPDHADPTYFYRFGISRRSVKALYVGRVTKEKNILFLIEVWVTAAGALLKDAKLRKRCGEQGHENMKFFNIENSFRHFASTHLEIAETTGEV